MTLIAFLNSAKHGRCYNAPKPWPPTHDVPPSVHERRSRKERKGKARGLSSHITPPAAPPSINWDDDLNDFMP